MFYKVIMMGGKEYQLDEEEMQIIKIGLAKGGFIQLRQAYINASSISSVEVDQVRGIDYRKELDRAFDANEMRLEEGKEALPLPAPKPLSNQFKSPNNARQLGGGN